MLNTPKLIVVNFLFFLCAVQAQYFDFKVITAVRHGIDISLDYIEKNIYRSNVDCILGAAFVRAFMKTAYQNGSHVMDNTSLRLLEKANRIIEMSRDVFENDLKYGNNWKFKYIVDDDIWSKNIKYQKNWLRPMVRRQIPLYVENIQSQFVEIPSSDICLGQIVNSTKNTREFFTPCIVTSGCWDSYFRSGDGDGYLLTHKLLLLQIAKARLCLLDEKFYEMQVKDLCSMVMSDISRAIKYGKIRDLFDLFLEQILLCGYEGFAEFIQNNWLYFILKSQRATGCFPAVLNDDLKSRIKKDVTYFEDGCNDHTTGLGAAVLALHYHYIVNEISM